MNDHKLTRLCYYGVGLLLCVIVIFFPPGNVLCYDVFGYYMYLPLGFKYHDVTIQNYDQLTTLLNKYHASETFYQALKWDNGNWVMRYPIGLAVLYAPFYFIADIVVHFTDYPADGFSRPYQLSILYGCLLYTLIGLHFLKKTLTFLFDDRTAALTLLAVGLGTNYFFHVSIHGQGAMSHNMLFSLYAIIVWLTIMWHKAYERRYMIGLGIACGLAALSRASEIICVIIPLLYGVTGWQSFKAKLKLLLRQKQQLVLFCSLLLGIGFIQLIYYKYASGRFVINPYGAGNPGEGLELFHPHLPEVLFSFRKGWFIYTPLMFFVVAGFVWLYKNNRPLFAPILIYSVINLYIVASWSCWWFGSCFGNRGLIASYAILSLPLGYFFDHVLKKRTAPLYLALLALFIMLNLFQSWQMRQGILDSTNMSRDYYVSIFLQTTPPTHEQKKLLLKGKFDTGIPVFTKDDSLTHHLNYSKTEGFEHGGTSLSDSIAHSGRYSLVATDHTAPFYLEAPHRDITQKSYTWIKASAWVYSHYPADSLQAYLQVNMKHKGWEFRPYKVFLTPANFRPNTWNKIECYYLTPDDLRSTKDPVCITFINKSGRIIYVDDMLMESYEPIVDRSVF